MRAQHDTACTACLLRARTFLRRLNKGVVSRSHARAKPPPVKDEAGMHTCNVRMDNMQVLELHGKDIQPHNTYGGVCLCCLGNEAQH